MLNKELKKEIIKLIIFAISFFFLFIYIKPIWHFLEVLLKLIMPFIIGLGIAFVLNILVQFLEKKVFQKLKIKEKKKYRLSIITSLLLVFSFIILLLLLIVPQIKNTTNLFINNMPEYQDHVIEILDKVGMNSDVRASIIEKSHDFGNKITSYLKDNSSLVFNNVLGLASSVIASITSLTIAFIFAIYLLLEKENLLRGINKLLQAYVKDNKIKKIKSIMSLSNHTFASFVSGQFLEAFIIGILCFMGMLVLRLPYSLTISVLVGFTALIPVFGAFIGTIFGAFLIFMVNPMKSLIFILFILILQQIEGNFIYPKVMSKRVNLPGIWVLVSVTIGASIAGIIGMLLSVPISSILYSILVTNVNERLLLKNKKEKEEEKCKE